MLTELIDPSKCPICGEPNQCAQEIGKATGKPPEACWCEAAPFSANLSAALLDRVPAEARNKVCICSK